MPIPLIETLSRFPLDWRPATDTNPPDPAVQAALDAELARFRISGDLAAIFESQDCNNIRADRIWEALAKPLALRFKDEFTRLEVHCQAEYGFISLMFMVCERRDQPEAPALQAILTPEYLTDALVGVLEKHRDKETISIRK